jgi:signal transduction histidine kinase
MSNPYEPAPPGTMSGKLHAFAITLENRLFHRATLASVLMALSLLIYSSLYAGNVYAIIVECICVVVFAGFYIASRDLSKAERLRTPFLISLWVLLNAGYLFGRGLGDSYVSIILVVVVITLILIPKRLRLTTLVIVSINLAAMITAEYIWPDLRPILGPEHRLRILFNSHIFLVICYAALVFMVLFLKSRYDELRSVSIEQNALLQQINDKLNLINDDLKWKNDAIAALNASLETKVEIRTAEIRAYQKRLLDIAFFQSHRMRGPLANILGILNLVQDESDTLEIRRLNTLMKAEANKLDDNLREMQQVLDNSGNGIGNDVF